MNKRIYWMFTFGVILSMALTACGGINLTATPTAVEEKTAIPPAPGGDQPFEIDGSFTYSNDIITTYYVEQAVALVDMYGFVKRDQEWEIPVASQTLGFLQLDTEKKTGEYTVQLPARPSGTLADVDNDGSQDQGVQVFAVSYWPNLTGGPYSEGDDRSRGWPTYLASVVTDTENDDEVIGGNLVVWSPDADQQFPSGFGADKKLFTADDPVAPISAGYSIVNLDQEPFSISREAQPKLTLFEPKDVAIKDFSGDSYTQAFDKMFEIVKKEYAFNGIEGKQPDWDKLYAEIKPRVEAAEKNTDPMAYFQALRDFTWAFKDGHVGLSGGDYGNQDFQEYIKGGYGFAVRELDDGKALVIYVLEGGPAAEAGIKVGAEITEFGGKPVKDAIGAAQSYSLQSADFALRYQQARYLLRAAPGTTVDVTFVNPEEPAQTKTLTAVEETQSFRRTSIYFGADTSSLVPVDMKILDSGVGYIRINSNYDDLGLIVRLFQRALDQFTANQIPAIIIDMRYNSGGANLGLAGFLTDQEIPMGQLEYYSEATGKFEPEGLPDKITANVKQYRFEKMALLVSQACFSACELESYGFSQVPGMLVVGFTPTAGVEAEVARGQFLLPENMSLQVPTGRFTLPDGSIFLEGQGVQPTVKVPVDETTALSTEDVVLNAAEEAVLGNTTSSSSGNSGNTELAGKGVTPSAPPKLADEAGVQKALDSRAKQLEELAQEQYGADALAKMDSTFPYTIALEKSQTLLWAWGWCAKDKTTLDANLKSIKLEFNLEGKAVPVDQFQKLDYQSGGQECVAYLQALSDWQGGENHLTTVVTFTDKINDGTADYPAGKQTFEYTVYVKP